MSVVFRSICRSIGKWSVIQLDGQELKKVIWLPHDLADFDDEVLANDDDDDIGVMSATVARGHGGDGGGDDPSRPPPRPIGIGCRGVGGRKATRGGSKQGTHKETRNLWLKKVTDEYGPLKIRFEFNDKGMTLHLSENFTRNDYMGLDLSTLLESLKMLKTGQRARSFAGRDPAHWLSSEIIRWRAPRPMSTRPSYRPSLDTPYLWRRIYQGRGPGSIEECLAEGLRRQYLPTRCALHRGPDNGHGSKGQATGGTFLGLVGFWPDRAGMPSLSTSLELSIFVIVQGLVYLILSNSSNVFSKSKMTKSFSFKPARSVSIRRIFAAIAEMPSGGEESPSSSSRGMRSFLTSEEDLCRFD
ncbi:hypothetical protein Tco_0134376 [Tanacetum coccineum]